MVRLRQHVERIPPELVELAREAVRNDRFALDQAGVAVRGLLGCTAAVDENDGATTLLQVQSGRYADHAGA